MAALGTVIDADLGNDAIIVGANLSDLFQIDGAQGTDTVELTGDYSAGYVFTNTTITNVEKLVLGAGFDYALTSDNANVAAGTTLTVDTRALGASDRTDFDGADESDGRFTFLGGAGNDTFTGGHGADHFTGGKGKDILTGGAGADQFIYTAIADSIVAAPDVIKNFSEAAHDKIDVSAIDAIAGTVANDAFSFIGTKGFHGIKGELRASAGGVIQGDVTGDGVADFQVTLNQAQTLHVGDFIL
jgi:serralysin